MRTALGSMLLLASVTCVLAEVPMIDFSGQKYHLDYQDQAKLPDGRPGEGLAEFTLPGETVNNWTKLFAFHSYPEVPQNPALAAATLGKTVKEFNVFKYAKAADGEGLIALQYAQRIKAKDMDVADFRVMRQHAVEEMAHTDVGPARDYFADEAGEEESPTDDQASKTDN